MTVLEDEERDRQAVEGIGRDWAEAVRHRDVDRLLDLVTEDVVFMPPNAPSVVGRAALEQAYRAFFAGFEVHRTFTPEEIQVGVDWAFVRGTDTLEMKQLQGGDPVVVRGRGISILRCVEDGSWKFARGITNAESPQKESG
jgi:ketosteroid isomerase-like protein